MENKELDGSGSPYLWGIKSEKFRAVDKWRDW